MRSVEDQADNMRISLGNEHVEWVESQYFNLLNRVGREECLSNQLAASHSTI